MRTVNRQGKLLTKIEKAIKRNELKITNNSTCVLVFKTNFIPHRGKLSILRLWSGELREGIT